MEKGTNHLFESNGHRYFVITTFLILCNLIFWFVPITNHTDKLQLKLRHSLYFWPFTFQSIGPCFMDTTPPDFSGSISVTHSNGTIIARWNSGAFTDPQEPFQLQLEFAIGKLDYLLLSIILSSIINDTDHVLLSWSHQSKKNLWWLYDSN